jgi:hypothetical protein
MPRRKLMFVWPRVIALREECFSLVCGRCGTFHMPHSYCRSVGCCPSCQDRSPSMVTMGHFHYWALNVPQGQPDQIVRIADMAGPFSDPFEAIMTMSRDLGLVCLPAKA